MNVYEIPLVASRAVLTAIGLSAIKGNEMDVIRGQKGVAIRAELPFSLSNLGLPNEVMQLCYSSKHQQVIENADLPTVTRGDVVVCFANDVKQAESVKRFYDAYNLITINNEKETKYLFIGVSNASHTQTLNPFDGLLYVVIDSKKVLD